MKSIPLILKELKRQFSDKNLKILSSLDALDASKPNYLDFATVNPLLDHYGGVLGIDKHGLKTEIDRAKIITGAAMPLKLLLYPNLVKLIRVSKTIPVGTATVERSFSAMNRILSFARNSLSSSRASDLMVLSLNRDITKKLDLDSVLNRWASSRARHLPFN